MIRTDHSRIHDRTPARKRQDGAALFVGLMLLLVIAIIGVLAGLLLVAGFAFFRSGSSYVLGIRIKFFKQHEARLNLGRH